jgi:hypothetical protein
MIMMVHALLQQEVSLVSVSFISYKILRIDNGNTVSKPDVQK